MSTLFWIFVAAALVWTVWKLSRAPGSTANGGDSSSTYYSDGGSAGTPSEADCGDSGSDGGSCDGGGGDGGGSD
jgi:hypothetical protein